MPWFVYALLAGVGISLVSLIQKRVLRQEHSLEYAMLFSVMKVLVFLPLFWSRIDWHITTTETWLFIFSSLIGSTGFLLIIKAIKRLEISTVSPLLALEPGLVTLLAVMVIGETIPGLALTGLLLALAGTYILELQQEPAGWWAAAAGSKSKIFQPFLAIIKKPGGWFAVLGLLAYTVGALVAKKILLTVPTETYLAYDFVFVAVIYLVIFFAQRRKLEVLRPGQGHLLFVILLIAVLHIAQSGAQATAIKLAPIGLVIAVKRVSVLFDVTVGGRLFHEHRLWHKLVAASIIVAGTLLIVLS